MTDSSKPELAELKIEREERSGNRGSRWLLLGAAVVLAAIGAIAIFFASKTRAVTVDVAAARPAQAGASRMGSGRAPGTTPSMTAALCIATMYP